MNWNHKQQNQPSQAQVAPGFFQLMVTAQSLSINLARQIVNHAPSTVRGSKLEGRELGAGR
ncbi:hypothetical protein [Microbulbifer epialgicus]|uniref:Uncharacterized protein n=1 Tax=Microbulbifer epialgicus TaxID=393907 RepID=A0ABV4NY37_9GAMM